MAWGAAQNLLTSVSSPTAIPTGLSTNWLDCTVAPALNSGESCLIQLQGTAGATASDLQFRILSSNDGGTTYDNVPYISGSLGWVTASVSHVRTFSVYGLKQFKMQISVSAAVGWTACSATYMLDGISA